MREHKTCLVKAQDWNLRNFIYTLADLQAATDELELALGDTSYTCVCQKTHAKLESTFRGITPICPEFILSFLM